MTMQSSPIAKVWDSVSKYGIRSGLANAASRWARNRLSVPYDVEKYYNCVLTEDKPAALAMPRSGPLTINWLIPGVDGGSGGLLNIFRAIHFLERWGHVNRVYLLETTKTGAAAREHARTCYFPVKAQIEGFAGTVADSDVLVATNWVSAYAVRGLSNTAGKFYFVQDLENRFYAEGSLSEFAKETYRWGFYGITLGDWIAEVLRTEFGMHCSPIGFSYDRHIYSPIQRREAVARKRILFYARPKTERRGFELGILALSLVAQRMPDVEIVLVGFPPQKIKLPFTAAMPGILLPAQLAELYRRSDVALVLSHTNISMLPLELMACECAVVSNRGSNVEWLLTRETTQLANPTPESLASAMLDLLTDERLKKLKTDAALEFCQRTDWEPEIRKMEAAFHDGLSIPQATCLGRERLHSASK